MSAKHFAVVIDGDARTTFGEYNSWICAVAVASALRRLGYAASAIRLGVPAAVSSARAGLDESSRGGLYLR